MSTVRTGNTYLMRAGDECVFVVNAEMKPEYNITVGKEYPGVIHSLAIDRYIGVNIINDAGENATHHVSFDCYSAGMSAANSVLPVDEYTSRVNILHAQNVEKLIKQLRVDLDGLTSLKDKMLEATNVTPSI